MPGPRFPARLHVLVPKAGKSALVIRRGPSKQTCILAWDLETDKFEVSQWLRGRIYERRSDISPDGKYWIYFAMNGHWDSPFKGSWTAIARVPWLKAISLMVKGDCWHGGGLFAGKNKYLLNDGMGHETLLATSELKKVPTYDGLGYFGGECPTVYYNRLYRDGWDFKGPDRTDGKHSTTIFEKNLTRQWTLRKTCHEQLGAPAGKGCYWDEHALISKSGEKFYFPDWEWAELIKGKIFFASRGCLYRIGILNPTKLSDEELIHDFNHYKFERREAPY